MAVLLSLATNGDKILSVSPVNGGYPGISHLGLGRLLGLKNFYFPYDDNRVNIDPRESRALMEREAPRLIFFGSSFIPFPHPVREVSNSYRDGISIFDGSHVMGLIAGGEFQDPLRQGCSLLIGSTHKSLPGPQGGMILSNNEEAFSKVSNSVHPGIVNNIHWNRVASLSITLIEMMAFAKSYAKAVAYNSQALWKSLDTLGAQGSGAAPG